MANPNTLAELRGLIAQLEGAPRVTTGHLDPGLPSLREALGGWPRPGVSELVGLEGSGRLRLVLPAVAELTRRRQPVAVVDPFGVVYPPGWAGVRLDRLLIVQCAPEQVGWAAEQLAGSGAFALVLLFGALRLGRAGPRLSRAVERGRCSVVVLAEQSEVSLPAALRVRVEGWRGDEVELRIQRRRGGASGGCSRISFAETGPATCRPSRAPERS